MKDKNKEILRLFIEEAYPAKEVAKICNLSYGYVRKILKKSGLDCKAIHKKRVGDKLKKRNKEIVKQCLDGKNSKEIAKEFGLNDRYVRDILTDMNLDLGKIWERKKEARYKEIVEMYMNGTRIIDIARTKGIDDTTVHKALRKNNIKRRDDKLLNLTNQRFGKLTALKRSTKRSPSGCVKWECICDCGQKTEVVTSELTCGGTKSCGCLASVKPTHRKSKTREYKLWLAAKSRAKRFELPFDIEIEDIKIPERCPVFPSIVLKNTKGKRTPSTPTLDRLIPKQGYVKNNIRVISWKANNMKSNSSLEELKTLVLWLEYELNVIRGG